MEGTGFTLKNPIKLRVGPTFRSNGLELWVLRFGQDRQILVLVLLKLSGPLCTTYLMFN